MPASIYRHSWSIFFVLAAGYMVTFFHRTAPAAVANDLMATFNISGAALGSLSAAYFWIYTLMQIPSGVLADRVGSRWSVGCGALITASGAFLFSITSDYGWAFFGRVLIGLGVSTVFIGLLKACSVWFPLRHYGKISGFAMLLGTAGSALAAAPLAWLLNYLDWREIYQLAAATSVLLAVLTIVLVRNTPEDLGFSPINPQLQPALPTSQNSPIAASILSSLWEVVKIPGVWAAAIIQFGVAAASFSFIGLWGIPLLQDSYGLSRSGAAGYATAMIVGAGLGTFAMGTISDLMGRRKPVIVVGSIGALLGWALLAYAPIQPGGLMMVGFFVFGLLATGTSVSYGVAKELVPSHQAGMAMALVNTGLFLGAALHQPIFGWLLDIGWDGQMQDGRPLYAAADYSRALLLNIGYAGLATLLLLFLPETWCGRPPPANNTNRFSLNG